jgi:hypothetical protein
MKLTRNWGWRLLGAWLILTGFLQAFPDVLHILHANIILGILAIIAGVLILLER